MPAPLLRAMRPPQCVQRSSATNAGERKMGVVTSCVRRPSSQRGLWNALKQAGPLKEARRTGSIPREPRKSSAGGGCDERAMRSAVVRDAFCDWRSSARVRRAVSERSGTIGSLGASSGSSSDSDCQCCSGGGASEGVRRGRVMPLIGCNASAELHAK